MKDFKKLIKEAYLGNPLNEEKGRAKEIMKDLFGLDFEFDYTYKPEGDKIIIHPEGYNPDGTLFDMKDVHKEKIIRTFQDKMPNTNAKPNMGGGITVHLKESLNEEDRDDHLYDRRQKAIDSIFGQEEEYPEFDIKDVRADLEDEMNEDYNRMHNVELNATYKDKLGVKDTKGLTRDDLIRGLKFHEVSMDEYGKPWMELSIAQKQELLSYMNRETEKQFQTDFQQRRQGNLDDEYDGMTDYQRRRMDEEFKKGQKVTYLGYPAVVTATDEYNGKNYVSVSYDKGNGKTKVRNILTTDGTVKPVEEGTCGYGKDGVIGDKPAGAHLQKEDMNDPVLVKARAAKMAAEKEKAKQAALNKKYGSSFMDKLDAEIDLKQELQDLKNERAQLMIDMEQEAEPEGGEIADLYGMKLNRIDLRTAEIRDELEDLRMYESVNEGYLERAIEDEKDPKKLAMLKAKKEFYDNNPKEKRRGMSDKEIGDEVRRLLKRNFMEEEIVTPNEIGALSVEKESDSAAYESLQESLRKKLQDRLK